MDVLIDVWICFAILFLARQIKNTTEIREVLRKYDREIDRIGGEDE